jgi:hypothetical protein
MKFPETACLLSPQQVVELNLLHEQQSQETLRQFEQSQALLKRDPPAWEDALDKGLIDGCVPFAPAG